MRKFGVFAATILITTLIAGAYGALHDQITYSICPEYFTKFKYRQFNVDHRLLGGHRPAVAAIGFLATWWVGMAIGFVLGLVGLLFKDHVTMRRMVIRAIIIVFVIALLFAVSGYIWGKHHLVETGVNWWMPDDLIHKGDYIIVGSIHNFSYLGGLAGLFFAVVYMIGKRITKSK